ncbi:Piwi domain-domain-containing protein [Clohesyomyces aquaticus]|uniref:Piwi domain-domain-containing protein n=1 Tax=Clohesyomyces aquaticus TaxID=1231657 RepID=A0A1Y1Y342_9PLEO|nr:Piwi domain-domain-containing protein [Clohesyomyces aquaticus]
MNRNDNWKPRTLVDQIVTSPYFMDFYLQSHNRIKGTAKSAHYFVLKNELGMKSADLQDLTFNLCHTYVRATLGASYASPAYYPDRLCGQGRCYLREFFAPTTTSEMSKINEPKYSKINLRKRRAKKQNRRRVEMLRKGKRKAR